MSLSLQHYNIVRGGGYSAVETSKKHISVMSHSHVSKHYLEIRVWKQTSCERQRLLHGRE